MLKSRILFDGYLMDKAAFLFDWEITFNHF